MLDRFDRTSLGPNRAVGGSVTPPNPITGTGPVLDTLMDGDVLSGAVTWGTYEPEGATTDRQMRVDGGAWEAYDGNTEVETGESWQVREVVSYEDFTRGFSSVEQIAQAIPLYPPINTVAPSISGTLRVGETVTGNAGTWDPEATSYNYRWTRDDSPISGATSSTYDLVEGDLDGVLGLEVQGVNDDGESDWIQATGGGVVEAIIIPVPENVTPAAITGSLVDGEDIAIGGDVWDPTPDEIQYELYSDDDLLSDDGTGNLTGLVGEIISGQSRARMDGGEWSEWVSATGGGEVQELTAEPSAFGSGQWSVARGDAKATVTITGLPANGGSAITDIEYRVGAGSWVSAARTTTGSFDIGSLTNGTEYSIQLRAKNAVGNGSASDTKTVTPATTPSAFTSGQWSVTRGNVLLAVTVSALPDDGGETITAIQYRLDGGSGWGSWTSSGISSTGSFNITGLSNGTEYDVQLRVVNAVGNGAASDTKSATPATVPSAFTSGQWTATEGVEQIVVAVESLPDNGGATVTDVSYRLDDGSWVSFGNTTGGTISGLTGGDEYDVQIRATNAVGSGAASDTKSRAPYISAPTNSVAPAITGDLFDGETLSRTLGSWSPTPDETEWRWLADASPAGTGSTLDLTGREGEVIGGEERARMSGGVWSDWEAATGGGEVQSTPPQNKPYRVGSATTAVGASVTLPAHQPGDLLIITGARSNNNTLITRPDGWNGPAGNGGDASSSIWGWKIAESDSEVSGTWANATFLIARAYRNHRGTGAVSAANGVGTSVTIPALTLEGDAARSLIDRYAYHKNAPTGLNDPANHDLIVTGGLDVRVGKLWNADGDQASATSTTSSESGTWRGYSVEVLANFLRAPFDNTTRSMHSGHSLTDAYFNSSEWYDGDLALIRDGLLDPDTEDSGTYLAKSTVGGSSMEDRWTADTAAKTGIDDYDALVITEAGPPPRLDITSPATLTLIDERWDYWLKWCANTIENGAGNEIILWSIWPYTDVETVPTWDNDTWLDVTFADALEKYGQIYETMAAYATFKMKDLYPSLPSDWRVWLIPGHRFWLRIVADLATSSVPTISSLGDLFGDTIHPNAVAQYGLACLAYTCLYQTDLSTTPGVYDNPSIDDDLQAYFRQIAWEIASEYEPIGMNGTESEGSLWVEGVDDDFMPDWTFAVPDLTPGWGEIMPSTVPVNTVAPTIGGTPTEGVQVSGTDGTWTNSPTEFEYMWRIGSETEGTDATFTPGYATAGGWCSKWVRARQAGGIWSEWAEASDSGTIVQAWQCDMTTSTYNAGSGNVLTGFNSGQGIAAFGSINRQPIPGQTFLGLFRNAANSQLAIAFAGNLAATLSGMKVYIDAAAATATWTYSASGNPFGIPVTMMVLSGQTAIPEATYSVRIAP